MESGIWGYEGDCILKLPTFMTYSTQRFRTCLATFLAVVIASICISGCEESVPDGRINVRNDIQDKSYNIIRVSGGGSSFWLKPGESRLLPKGTQNISMSRRYENFTRSYQVECPSRIGSGITVKMINVHLNKIGGGCQTVSGIKE